MITSLNKVYSQFGFAGCCQSTTLAEFAVHMCKCWTVYLSLCKRREVKFLLAVGLSVVGMFRVG